MLGISRGVFAHIRLGHVGGVIVRIGGGEGILGGGVGRGGGVQRESKAAYDVRDVQENRLSEGILSYCKGNCGPASPEAETSKALTGDPKLSLLRSSRLVLVTYLTGDPKRKGWGSHCRYSSIYVEKALVRQRSRLVQANKKGSE